MVSFIWQVDPFSSVSAAHGVGENVRHQIHKSHPEVSEVFIHIGVFPGLWSHHLCNSFGQSRMELLLVAIFTAAMSFWIE